MPQLILRCHQPSLVLWGWGIPSEMSPPIHPRSKLCSSVRHDCWRNPMPSTVWRLDLAPGETNTYAPGRLGRLEMWLH